MELEVGRFLLYAVVVFEAARLGVVLFGLALSRGKRSERG